MSVFVFDRHEHIHLSAELTVSLICLQIVEPITATVVLPFVNQFVRDITGGNERKTGYYAGLIGTAFFLSEGLVVFHWGWLSDRVGRRPVLLLGPIGVSLAMISFGASSHFWMLVATRCAQGVFNGNIGVSKTVIAEITDSTNLADAYAMMPLTWTLGSTVGPVLGGILAEPAKRWPSFFGKISYFTDRPYFLPCAATGFFALMVAFVAFIGLKEASDDIRQLTFILITVHQTLPSVVERRREYMIPSQSTALVGQNAPNYRSTGVPQIDPTRKAVMEAPVPFKGLLIPQVLTPLLVYTTLAFINISLHVLLPLMYSTSIAVGGLGFDAYRIGVIMGIFGCATACVQFFLLAKLVRRFGPRNVVALAQLSYVVNIAFYPALNFFARRAGKVDGTVWAIVVAQLVSRLPAGMGWGISISSPEQYCD
ncbi:hypothetical protein C0991_005504 [Blastosporella zonata]|nr:hypothetical protein C0991_005504 [Blastosporella zonata]